MWMGDNADVLVWEGMRFRDLACNMSHLQEPYDVHLKRMLCDKQWVDVSVIHALACVFRVDVAIWQEHLEPMLVGHSMSSSDPASALLSIALKMITISGVLPRLLKTDRNRINSLI